MAAYPTLPAVHPLPAAEPTWMERLHPGSTASPQTSPPAPLAARVPATPRTAVPPAQPPHRPLTFAV